VKCQLTGKYLDHLSLFDIAFRSQEVPLSTGCSQEPETFGSRKKPANYSVRKRSLTTPVPARQINGGGASLSTHIIHKAHFISLSKGCPPAAACIHIDETNETQFPTNVRQVYRVFTITRV
jgi:hypothetical protein